MIYTPDTKKAIKLCFEAHRNQTDKSGLPYVFHPFHVAEQMPDEETTIVALLHDVIEDASYTLDDLRKMGFAEEVLDALDLMTHDKNVPYMEYVAKISENEIARTVKLADLRHNSDLTRLDEIDDKARNRIEKYKAGSSRNLRPPSARITIKAPIPGGLIFLIVTPRKAISCMLQANMLGQVFITHTM